MTQPTRQHRPAKSSVKPHLFVVDPDVPGCCARCHLPGKAGDPRHTLPDVPEQAAHIRRYESEGA